MTCKPFYQMKLVNLLQAIALIKYTIYYNFSDNMLPIGEPISYLMSLEYAL